MTDASPIRDGRNACRFCGAFELRAVNTLAAFPRVTSDAKPFPPSAELVVCNACGGVQKPHSERLEAETAAIYADYDIFYQSGGVEQASFDAQTGALERRSDRLCRHLKDAGVTPRRALDIGCGSGGMARALARAFPGVRIDGFDLDARQKASLEMIDGFETLVVGDLARAADAAPEGYDLITMIHVLEHVPAPLETLKILRSLLAPGGAAFVQAPDWRASPLDLLVADHVSHFDAASLTALMARASLAPVGAAANWIQKELSVLAQPGDAPSQSQAAAPDEDIASHAAWLDALQTAGRRASEATPFAIFGTSLAGVWASAALPRKPDMFLDEDPARMGRTLFDRPVLHPDDAPAGLTVLLALPPAAAGRVRARFAAKPFHFVEADWG